MEPFFEGGFDRFRAPNPPIGWLQGYLAHRKTTGEPRIQKNGYRGTSLARKRTLLGPYRRPMPRVLGGS